MSSSLNIVYIFNQKKKTPWCFICYVQVFSNGSNLYPLKFELIQCLYYTKIMYMKKAVDFGCYICYYLHYGFKISMLLQYNLLLVITLITCHLNILVFKLHDYIPCLLAKQLSLLLLYIYKGVAIFKCLSKIFYKR